jgi:molybdate transport system regulatory protein
MVGDEIALGPGRVDLLELVQKTGSLRAAAARMGMSYMRAWHLVKYTNRCFNEPVIEVIRGGKSGGGAKLTAAGRRVVALYRQLEEDCFKSAKRSWSELRKQLVL